MGSSQDAVTRAGLSAADRCLSQSLDRIRHCLGQLDDRQLWWRPAPEMNAIGNLLLHLSGNARQWVVAGLGGAPDIRDRPGEFAARGPLAGTRLLAQLEQTVADAREVIQRAAADDMLCRRTIQGFNLTGWEVLWDSLTHFQGHTQEIIALSRMQLGPDYVSFWRPETPEEGADARAHGENASVPGVSVKIRLPRGLEVQFELEPELPADEWIEVMRESTLAERRPAPVAEDIRRMLDASDVIVVARIDDRVVGVSRAVTDFAQCTYLADLAVAQPYQRRGIGRELVRRTHAAAGEHTLLLLLAAPGAVSYYPHIGMTPHESCWVIPRTPWRPGSA
jgi:predicted N-acetyltransferase YhbS